jgi:hypothetical protein
MEEPFLNAASAPERAALTTLSIAEEDTTVRLIISCRFSGVRRYLLDSASDRLDML